MSKPFDATLNHLIDLRPEEWAGFFATRAGVPIGPVEVLDTDLSSTLQADKLFRLNGARPSVLHVEFESSGRLGIPEELLRYNVAARGWLGLLPVHSVVVLLRPKSNATDLTGVLEAQGADGRPYLTMRYTVIRLWQEPTENLLAAGPSLAPLALLTNEAAADMPAAVGRFRERLRADRVPDTLEKQLISLSYVLCGLRYSPDQIERFFMGLDRVLEDSSTYQLILNRGRAEGLNAGLAEGTAKGKAEGKAEGAIDAERKILLILGRRRFGVVPPEREAAVAGIADRGRLERMAERIIDATDWDDLLATP